ncbi:MAG: hypothetical protein JWL81_436, partial [Verrucomicrobiales bacterium]|nr:hypothetical protein [Verrucomicrobiales bacterium]
KHGLSKKLCLADMVAKARSGDFPRLLELVGKDSDSRKFLLRCWAESDPVGAAEWAAPIFKSHWAGQGEREDDVAIIFSTWGKKDPESAMAFLKANTVMGEFTFWAGCAVERGLDEDEEAGARMGALLGSSVTLGGVHCRGVGQSWVVKNPARAAELLSGLPSCDFRDAGMSIAINVMSMSKSKTDLAQAIQWHRQFPSQSGEQGKGWNRSTLYQEWAGEDPDSLSEYLENEAPPWERNIVGEALAKVVAKNDPVGAMTWARDHLQGGPQATVIAGILRDIAVNDPQAALGYLETLPPGSTLQTSLDSFSHELSDRGSSALLEMAESLKEGPVKSGLRTRAYLQEYDANAETLLRKLVSTDAANLPEGIWQRLGERNGEIAAGMKGLELLPPEAAKEFVGGLFTTLTEQGFGMHQFTESLAMLKEPALRLAALESGTGVLVGRYPSLLVDWAKSLPAAEREAVARTIEKSSGWMAADDRRKLVAPLR